MSKFQIGDVVALASGGTKKTVSAIGTKEHMITLTWEDTDGYMSHEEYDERLYQKVVSL